jgi:amino acid permease
LKFILDYTVVYEILYINRPVGQIANLSYLLSFSTAIAASFSHQQSHSPLAIYKNKHYSQAFLHQK